MFRDAGDIPAGAPPPDEPPPEERPPKFGTDEKLDSHFQKHVLEQGEFINDPDPPTTPEEYQTKAQDLMSGRPGVKTYAKSNGDTLYYDPATNEFGVKSSDGVIRTYFKPVDDGTYWNTQTGAVP